MKVFPPNFRAETANLSCNSQERFLAHCKGMLLNQAHGHATALLQAGAQCLQERVRFGDWKAIEQNPEKITHKLAKTANLWVKSHQRTIVSVICANFGYLDRITTLRYVVLENEPTNLHHVV
jgi:hypothetical protein